MFGAILTKWRNQLSTETLALLAELKMYVHEEHICNDVVKKQLKCQCCDGNTGSDRVAEPTQALANDAPSAQIVINICTLLSRGREYTISQQT